MKNFSELKKLIFVIFTVGVTTTQVIASEALLEGVRPFICNGSAVVLLETETGWVNPSDPSAELTRIKTGWRMEDPLSGQVAYLIEENRNSWSIEVLSEEGYAKVDCMDIADSVSDVVTIIKPKLDQNISQTQEDLNSVKEHLMKSVVEISELKLENEKVLENLNKTKATLEAKHKEYIQLRSFVTQNPSGALLVLNELLTMSPSERNQAIRKSTLGTKAINQSGMLPTCVKILRDKAKMSSGCKDRITDFLVVEGW